MSPSRKLITVKISTSLEAGEESRREKQAKGEFWDTIYQIGKELNLKQHISGRELDQLDDQDGLENKVRKNFGTELRNQLISYAEERRDSHKAANARAVLFKVHSISYGSLDIGY